MFCGKNKIQHQLASKWKKGSAHCTAWRWWNVDDIQTYTENGKASENKIRRKSFALFHRKYANTSKSFHLARIQSISYKKWIRIPIDRPYTIPIFPIQIYYTIHNVIHKTQPKASFKRKSFHLMLTFPLHFASRLLIVVCARLNEYVLLLSRTNLSLFPSPFKYISLWSEIFKASVCLRMMCSACFYRNFYLVPYYTQSCYSLFLFILPVKYVK